MVSLFPIMGFCADVNPTLDPVVKKKDLIISVRAPKTVVPGKFATFILALNNSFDFDLNLILDLKKPDSWTLLSKQETFQLKPGETQNVVFLMRIDRSCDFGKQYLNFDFFDSSKDIHLKEQIVTEVENIHDIQIQAVRLPRFVLSNNVETMEYEVSNYGNCEEVFYFSSTSGTVLNKEYTLTPNSTINIKVQEKTPKNILTSGTYGFGATLKVSYKQELIRVSNTIKIFPKNVKKVDAYHRFPITLSTIYFGAQVGTPYKSNLQGEAIGRGFLDINDRHELSFTLRAPNRFEIARVGNADQYSMEYIYHKRRLTKTSIRVGDFSYSLTELTELFRWSRGVGVEQVAKKLTVGAFANAPRFVANLRLQYAAYAIYNYTENWSGQLSYLQRFYDDNTASAMVGSYKNKLLFRGQSITAEYSRSVRDERSGYGAALALTGGFKKLSYNSQIFYASPQFDGYFSNSILTNNGISYRLTDNVRLNTSFSINRSNPLQDTTFTNSSYSLTYTAGAFFNINKAIRGRAEFVHREQEDRATIKRFDYVEDGIRYGLSYSSKKWQANFIGDLARAQNRLVSEDDISTTIAAALNVNRTFREKYTFGAFSSVIQTGRYGTDIRTIVLYGASVAAKVGDHLSVGASARNNYLVEEYTTDRNLLDVNATYVHGKHRFTAVASSAILRNTINRTDFFITAKYSYTLGLGTQKKEGFYSLEGQITAEDRKDAGGIIISIAGQTVISDNYGHFVINNLPEGIHYLNIDYGTIPVGYLPANDIPIEVIIYPKDNNIVKLDLVKTGNILGSVALDSSISKTNLFKLPRSIIKAKKGNLELLTYSDDKGNFVFKHLIPGEWIIRVVSSKDADLDPKNNNQIVEVKSSKQSNISFVLKKKSKNIKFQSNPINVKVNR